MTWDKNNVESFMCSVLSKSLQPHGPNEACQIALSIEFARQEYLSGLPFLTPGDLPDAGIEPKFPALAGSSLPLCYPGTMLRCHQTKYRKLS